DTAFDVDLREPCKFGLRLLGELSMLARAVGLLGIGLGADRHVFASNHRHRTGDEAGDSGDHHLMARTRSGRGNHAARPHCFAVQPTVSLLMCFSRMDHWKLQFVGDVGGGGAPKLPYDRVQLGAAARSGAGTGMPGLTSVSRKLALSRSRSTEAI